MNRREREVRRAYLSLEEGVARELARQYAEAKREVEREITRLLAREQTSSVAYQVQFQSQLESELGKIAEVLREGTYESVSQFLEEAYTTGWNGTFYNLDGQGVNLNIGVRPDIGARVLQTAHEVPLSARLYASVERMQIKAAAELTRGLAQGKGYREMARRLAQVSGESYRNMERIIRTEGHRVFETAQYEAMQEAVENGAEVVKEWDATLDHRVRPLHAELHGQTAEVDEDFSIADFTGAYPGGFGVAEMDINCRCTATQKADWDYESVSDYDDFDFTNYQISVN